MNRAFVTMIRREFWENKSLWIAPVVVAALTLAGATFGRVGQRAGITFGPGSDGLPNASEQMSAVSLTGIMVFMGAVAGFAVFAYLLDCLYAERRDRSILFWKSLPVSDAQSVLAKLAVAMLVVPAGVILLAMLTQTVATPIAWLRFEALRPYINLHGFAAWPPMLARIGAIWLFSVLWFAPVATYLMLASVLAKRAPLVYAILPPLVLVLGERLIFDSMQVFGYVFERVFPWRTRLMHLLGPDSEFRIGPPVQGPVDWHWWIPFQDPKLWIGLAVAAGMLYIVIRLRRYRDDT